MASGLEDYLLSVIGEPKRPGLTASLLRGFLGGCAGMYGLGLEGYLAGEEVGLRHRDTLPIPVISIGNLTVGGTGKTPMTQMLCRALQRQGKRVAILSRGHGGQGQSVRVVSDDEGSISMGAPEAGDEPVLLARTLPGVPVLVGKDRRQSGDVAIRWFSPDVLILDDGFQFWQLSRDLDIVLLDARRPFDNGFSLPRGLLREPKGHLKRAGIIVFTRAAGLTEGERGRISAEVNSLAPGASLYFAAHRPAGFVPVSDLTAPMRPLNALVGQSVYAVSAIAQPQSFVQSLECEADVRLVGQQAWSDHHAINPAQVRSVIRDAVKADAQAVVMTEKDAVKWPAGIAGDLPVYALRIEMAVENEAKFLREVMERSVRH